MLSSRAAIAIALFAIAINIPFVNQAFHMDDGIFLIAAKNVSHNPLFPQDVPVLFEGVSVADLGSTEHPPLTVYFMALCARMGGFSEVALHAGFLLFPAILGIATYSLARRFTSHPMIAAVALLCLPVVYVMSHTLMADLPLVALWTASVALFVHGVDSSRTKWIAAGVGVASMAALISYAGLCLVPLLALYAVLHRSRTGADARPPAAHSLWFMACGQLLPLRPLHSQFSPQSLSLGREGTISRRLCCESSFMRLSFWAELRFFPLPSWLSLGSGESQPACSSER